MDQEIQLAEPNFIPLAPEEAAEAVRLLAALIRAVRVRRPDSTFPPRQKSAFQADLAGGSPSVPIGQGQGGLTRRRRW